jgi:hypothetical protein
MKSDQLSKYAFTGALLLAAFLYGVLVPTFEIFPHSILKQGYNAALDWKKSWKAYIEVEPTRHLEPALHDGDGVVAYNRELAYPGQTLITSTWKEGDDWFNGFRLLDMEGRLINEWRISPEFVRERMPNPDPQDKEQWSRWKTDIHGAVLLPNGDIIFSFEYLGLVRINACSEVVWVLDYVTHHSVFLDDQGFIWASGRRSPAPTIAEYPGLVAPYEEETAIKVSLDGDLLQELSLIAPFYESGYEGLLFSRKRGGKGIADNENDEDFLHLNDVEVLSAEKAPAFPGFDAGDIMVSFRHIDTVMILDAKSGKIKWAMPYASIGQHDPDFTSRGTITLFDNRTGTLAGKPAFDGSRILEIDPSQNRIEVLAPLSPETRFYTFSRGKHQNLPNGNILITEYEGGRVFEMTPAGDVVWTYINRWDDNRVAKVVEGSRYDIDPAVFESPECRQAVAGN